MIFSEDFIASVKAEPFSGAIQIVKKAREYLIEGTNDWTDAEYDALLEAYALLSELIYSGLLPIEYTVIDIQGDRTKDSVRISDFLREIDDHCVKQAAQLKLVSLKSHFKTSLATGFCYEFSQGDLTKVQALLNQIRDLITATKGLELDHKQRLLKRLEKLQAEIHKKVSDLDRFWGLIGDAGVVLGKLGIDAKPIVDRIKEIADIIWQTQSRAEELPSGTQPPMLEHKHDKDDITV